MEGIYNLYVVYNLPDGDNIGTNIYGLYLDPGQNPEEPQPATGDLFILLMKSNAENIELVTDASFDVGYGNIGNTSENTVIGLGEVDFGTDGNAYQATGVEFANGWGTYGEAKYVVLSAGATPEEAVPFNEIRVEKDFRLLPVRHVCRKHERRRRFRTSYRQTESMADFPWEAGTCVP